MKAGVCIGFLQEQSFFLWDKVLAVVLVTVQGDCNSPLVTGISLHVLHFSFGWVSSIFVKMASKLLFWFSEERYFLNSCFLLWYSHFEQSTPERDSFAIRVAITNIFFWKFAISVLVLLSLSDNMQSSRKRGSKQWVFCVFCCCNCFFWPRSLLKLWEHYPSLDRPLQLLISVPCCYHLYGVL